MKTRILNWLKSEEAGQGMVEYALIVALIAVVLIGTVTALSGKMGNVFGNITTALGRTPGADGEGGTTTPPCAHAEGDVIDHKCDACGDPMLELCYNKCPDEGCGMNVDDINNPYEHFSSYVGTLDHKCDLPACGRVMSQCSEDTNTMLRFNHRCDICKAPLNLSVSPHKHLDEDIFNEATKCSALFCGQIIHTCADNSPFDHKCDTCHGQINSEHRNDGNYRCQAKDYGCTHVFPHTCVDDPNGANFDHKCDICDEPYNVDNHVWDANLHCTADGCPEVQPHECLDADLNHACDRCTDEMGGAHNKDENDSDKDHKCNYCNQPIDTCADVGDTAPHDAKCDWCGAEYHVDHKDEPTSSGFFVSPADGKCDLGCGYHQYKQTSWRDDACKFCSDSTHKQNSDQWYKTTK